MIIDIRTLKRKVDSINTNIAIYEKDVERQQRKLSESGVTSISKRVAELKKENKELIIQEQRLLKRANRILRRIE